MRIGTLVKATALSAVLASVVSSNALAAGVSGPAFYVDGAVYRTVGTPTDLSGTGGPDHSFDTTYSFSGAQMNVATAAPGDRDYNGGRWRVRAFDLVNYPAAIADATVDTNDNDVIDSDAELMAAVAKGYITIGGVVRSFVCPVIPLPKGGK